MLNNKKIVWLLAVLSAVSMIISACAPQTVTVVQTQVVTVKETQKVEVPVIQTQVVAAKSFTKPHPILGNIKVRQAIAYCTNRNELIASVYPWLPKEQQADLFMNTFIPRVHWANEDGADVVKYPFDLAKGQALLTEAGWKAATPTAIRTNDKKETLSIKFTTTNAAFRQTWAAVFEAQMKKCGVEILRLHTPSGWFFGSTTGLRRRDFELGAYAWVGQTDPSGRTLYSCTQIPVAENDWQGQNYMGWCNKAASDAINAANNTLLKEDRKKFYKIAQVEFAKDMISLPVFQRAEGNAAVKGLKNFKPSTTEYYTWNSHEWELEGGRDSLVLGLTQEPASMYSLVESAAVQRVVAKLVFGNATSQVDYDYQPHQLAKLATIESGLAKNNDVEVKEGDPVVDSDGNPTDAKGELLKLAAGMKVQNAKGEVVTVKAGDKISMKQLVVTYQWVANKWSDGTPVTKADFELAYKQDCDKKSGAVSFITCNSIQKVDFTSNTEYTVTYKPGFQAPTYFLQPFSYYPSQQVIQSEKFKGKKLAEVPPEAWATLPEIAETPMGTGPYVIKKWDKAKSITLEANPNFYKGAPKIKKITVVFIADTNQAVAQLLTGAVDALGSETLGAGNEVKLVLDAKDKIQTQIKASGTWEHIDMNLNVP